MKHVRVFLLFAVALTSSQGARAQDDVRSGLFAVARQLPLVEQSLHVTVAGSEATLKLTQVFVNNGDAVGQADYRLRLPTGATVSGFGFYNDGRFLTSSLKAKEQAEVEHKTAAAEGRSTGISRGVQGSEHFSVYPVKAGQRKRVQVVITVPVVVELGRAHVRVPMEHFVGSSRMQTSVFVELSTQDRLASVGLDEGRVHEVGRGKKDAIFAFDTSRATEIWWKENTPPLAVGADVVALQEGDTGVAFRASFSRAAEKAKRPRELHVLVDTSFSMRRHVRSVATAIERFATHGRSGGRSVRFHFVSGTHGMVKSERRATDDIVRALFARKGRHSTSWRDMQRALSDVGCGRVPRARRPRCVVITDAQLPGIEEVDAASAELLVLADTYEREYAADRLPATAAVYIEGADSSARLLALADELVLPVLEVTRIRLGGRTVEALNPRRLRVAEGGVLRLNTRIAGAVPKRGAQLRADGNIDGRAVELLGKVEHAASDGAGGRQIRRAVYLEQLKKSLLEHGKTGDGALKDRIIALSIRENIPTPFTARHVSDPRLSLYALKPGDPLLTVGEEAGLVGAVAFYPFGEVRALTWDAASRSFVDRFLVPRYWEERRYGVDVFKHYSDGRVEQSRAFYRIDATLPDAVLSVDKASRRLVVGTGRWTGSIASVQVHDTGRTEGGVHTLAPLGERWAIDLSDLSSRFRVVVRDRAGNRREYVCALDAELTLTARAVGPVDMDARAARNVSVLRTSDLGTSDVRIREADGSGIVIRDGVATATIVGQTRRFPARGLRLRSTRISASAGASGASGAESGKTTVWFGTPAGDLVALTCEGAECTSERIDSRYVDHPITGIALPRGGDHASPLVAILGAGLFEFNGKRLKKTRRYPVGSRVTSMLRAGPDVLIGTADRGLFRLVSGRARGAKRTRLIKTRFPHLHVGDLRRDDQDAAAPVTITSGFGEYRRTGRDSYERVGAALRNVGEEQRRYVDAATFAGEYVVASFDRGLFRLRDGRLEPWLADQLGTRERHVNALYAHRDRLWVATEAGLLAISKTKEVTRTLSHAVYDIASDHDRLAFATSQGVYLLDAGGRMSRIDAQSGTAMQKFSALAFMDDDLYAGGLDGLVRLEWQGAGPEATVISSRHGFGSAWVTALHAHGGRLIIGTYDEGVYELRGDLVSAIPSLRKHWVPARGITQVGADLWIGGLGMPAVVITPSASRLVQAPASDVFRVIAPRSLGASLLLLTSNGVMAAPLPGGAGVLVSGTF